MSRSLLLLSLGIAFAATGQPRGARTTAASLGSGKDDDPAPSAPASDAEIALLKGALYAFEPAPLEIRVLAVEDLGLLGDPRAVNLLAQLLFDPNLSIRSAALRSISLFGTRRAEEVLCNVVRHPEIPDRLKLQALEALVFQRAPSARHFLEQVSTQNTNSAPVQAGARRALSQWGPKPTTP